MCVFWYKYSLDTEKMKVRKDEDRRCYPRVKEKGCPHQPCLSELCQLYTAKSHLRSKSQLRDCSCQIGHEHVGMFVGIFLDCYLRREYPAHLGGTIPWAYVIGLYEKVN